MKKFLVFIVAHDGVRTPLGAGDASSTSTLAPRLGLAIPAGPGKRSR